MDRGETVAGLHAVGSGCQVGPLLAKQQHWVPSEEMLPVKSVCTSRHPHCGLHLAVERYFVNNPVVT